MWPTRFFGLPAFSNLRSEIDRLFNDFGAGQRMRPFPPLNVWEDERTLYAEVELPGLKMDDLEIFVTGHELSIKGQRQPSAGDDHTYLRQERGAGEFTRFLSLPVEIDADRVEATLTDGVLSLKLPKAESVLARKIAVKTA
jgi:HSP20 family protein